jgi:hypothetical protein
MSAMQKWLARLSFSCFIIAAVLAWEGYKLLQNQSRGSLLYFVGAGALGALGAAGVRARHQDN